MAVFFFVFFLMVVGASVEGQEGSLTVLVSPLLPLDNCTETLQELEVRRGKPALSFYPCLAVSVIVCCYYNNGTVSRYYLR